MYVRIQASPNGSCLFISLRLALECNKVLDTPIFSSEEPNPCARAVINGQDPRVLKSSENLRSLIVQWYQRHLAREVPDLGTYVHNGRAWNRGDLIAVEMISKQGDIPDEPNDPKRISAMHQYLTHIQRGAWGSTPEYTAFAFMANCIVEVYQVQTNALECSNPEVQPVFLINCVRPTDATRTVKLLYSGHNHYDLLVSQEEKQALLIRVPTSCIETRVTYVPKP